ncbi:MAG: hypothetical protein ACJ776_10895 [Chloroflexota bacterium]
MQTRYEVEPERIGRSAGRRRPAALIAITLVTAAALLVKPWERADSALPAVVPTPGSVVAVAPPVPRILLPRPSVSPAAPAASPTWPSERAPSLLAAQTAKQAEGALAALTEHAGHWGVGTAGVGPRMLRDEPWSDWTPSAAEVVDGAPIHVASWPDTDLCAGYPTIYDRPTLVAITMPRDVAPDLVLRGWWTDGANVASLGGSVVQISPPGNRGIGYLERLDQAPWPRGRYEFHVVVGSASVSLTVCLTRRG